MLRPPHGNRCLCQKILYSAGIIQLVILHQSWNIQLLLYNVSIKGIVQVIPVYRANKCSHDLLKSHMEDLMLKVDPTIPYVVFGDFNVNASTSGNMISDLERIIGCSQLVKVSTTIHNTTIDLVFCNIPEATVGTIISVHSDHKIVVVQ